MHLSHPIARSDELHQLMRSIEHTQSLVLVLDTLTPVECLMCAHELCADLPRASSEIERVCLASVLLNFSVKLVDRLHRVNDFTQPCACALSIPDALHLFLVRPLPDPRAIFDGWLESFVEEFRQQHPLSTAEFVYTLVDSFPERHWTVSELARRANCPQRRLTIDFRRRWSMSIQRFIEMRRVAIVFDHICAGREKLAYIAHLAGYESPKDFYRAVRNTTGMTPGMLRKQSTESHELILRLLKASHAPANDRRTT